MSILSDLSKIPEFDEALDYSVLGFCGACQFSTRDIIYEDNPVIKLLTTDPRKDAQRIDLAFHLYLDRGEITPIFDELFHDILRLRKRLEDQSNVDLTPKSADNLRLFDQGLLMQLQNTRSACDIFFNAAIPQIDQWSIDRDDLRLEFYLQHIFSVAFQDQQDSFAALLGVAKRLVAWVPDEDCLLYLSDGIFIETSPQLRWHKLAALEDLDSWKTDDWLDSSNSCISFLDSACIYPHDHAEPRDGNDGYIPKIEYRILAHKSKFVSLLKL
jgi:hypothetical protein